MDGPPGCTLAGRLQEVTSHTAETALMGGVIFRPLPLDVRRGIGARAIYLTRPAFPQLLLSNWVFPAPTDTFATTVQQGS